MPNIDRILQLASQRRALQEAVAERRLKACLRADADRADRTARQVIATASLRALSDATAYGMKAQRPHDDKAAPLPHPNAKGRKPLSSPAAEVADKGRKWGGILPGSFETGRR